MLSERLLKLPGFIYEVNGDYYFLGKWICKACTDVEATDCVVMYQMCRNAKEEPETNIYFQKIRAFSDFALDVPFTPAKIQADMTSILDTLSPAGVEFLTAQVHCFEEDLLKYCNQQV